MSFDRGSVEALGRGCFLKAYCYTISTDDSTTALQSAVLHCGLLRLLIILWRKDGQKCGASTACFVSHHVGIWGETDVNENATSGSRTSEDILEDRCRLHVEFRDTTMFNNKYSDDKCFTSARATFFIAAYRQTKMSNQFGPSLAHDKVEQPQYSRLTTFALGLPTIRHFSHNRGTLQLALNTGYCLRRPCFGTSYNMS